MTEDQLSNLYILSYRLQAEENEDDLGIDYFDNSWRECHQEHVDTENYEDFESLIEDLDNESKSQLLALIYLGRKNFESYDDAFEHALNIVNGDPNINEYLIGFEVSLFYYLSNIGDAFEILGLR